GFPKNSVADQRAQRAANYHLHRLSQEQLEFGDQASRKPRRSVAGHVNEETHIAFGRVLAARHRAEEPDIARAVPGGHPQDFVPMLFYALTGAHPSTIVSSDRQNGRSAGAACRPWNPSVFTASIR